MTLVFNYYHADDKNYLGLRDTMLINLALSKVIFHNIAERANVPGVRTYYRSVEKILTQVNTILKFNIENKEVFTVKSIMAEDDNQYTLSIPANKLELLHFKDMLEFLFESLIRMISQSLNYRTISGKERQVINGCCNILKKYESDLKVVVDYKYKPTRQPERKKIKTVCFVTCEE